jgi:hypothetical protein
VLERYAGTSCWLGGDSGSNGPILPVVAPANHVSMTALRIDPARDDEGT